PPLAMAKKRVAPSGNGRGVRAQAPGTGEQEPSRGPAALQRRGRAWPAATARGVERITSVQASGRGTPEPGSIRPGAAGQGDDRAGWRRGRGRTHPGRGAAALADAADVAGEGSRWPGKPGSPFAPPVARTAARSGQGGSRPSAVGGRPRGSSSF